jgi:hypothetical protein
MLLVLELVPQFGSGRQWNPRALVESAPVDQ